MIILWICIATLVSALLIAELLRSGMAWRIATDHPNARSMHTRVTPRIGGLGIMAALALAVCLAPMDMQTRLIGLVALGLSGLSLLDDRKGLPVLLRFGAHWVAAALAVWITGLSYGSIMLALLACFACVWMTNLYNFMDGSDGMAGGMALIGFSALGAAAQGSALGVLCAVIAAGALGFLFFNWHPARVFMGDCGSVPIGFLAAAVGLAGATNALWPWWFPLWVFSPFVVDATVTLLRRALRAERVWQAHREHYYQRAIRMGLGHTRVAVCWYAAMVCAGLTALLALSTHDAIVPTMLGSSVCVAYCIAAVVIDRKWHRFAEQERNHA